MTSLYDSETSPDKVGGYQLALQAGVIKLPPTDPPHMIAGISAVDAFWIFIVSMVLTGALWWMLVNALNTYAGLTGVWRLVMIVPGITWFLGVLWALRQVGHRLYAELAAGYVTLPLLTGGFSIGDGRAFGLSRVRGPWNFKGVWNLDRCGNVRSAPDRSVWAPPRPRPRAQSAVS